MKLFGIILLFFSAFATAASLLRSDTAKVSVVSALCELMTHAANSISRYSMPSSHIFLSAREGLLTDCGYQAGNIPESFSEFCNACVIEDSEARAVLIEFCKGFGKGDRTSEADACRRCAETMHLRAERLRGIIDTRRRVIFALSFGAAAAAVLLLM